MLAPGDMALLQVVLRARNLDAGYLARTLGRSTGEIQGSLERLSKAGVLPGNGDGSPLAPPQESLVAAAADTLDEQARTALALSQTLRELPGLIRDWDWGLPEDESAIPIEVITGRTAIVDAWWRYIDRSRPVSTVGVIPDAHGFLLVSESDAARLVDFLGPHGGGIRLIVDPATLDHASRPVVDALRRLGMQFRTLDNPPGWFFADGDKVAALPAQWGDRWPERILLARNPVIAEALRAYFELLWHTAADIDDTASRWQPILELLGQGLTDEQIAALLHVSSRTVRRRVDQAVHAYGATNRFTLGHAWARSRSRGVQQCVDGHAAAPEADLAE